ncbi:hypothetical protein VTJ83DRAFT_187 [Remersonia thermophila]|uniref:Mitochondrial outer membrane transport complex Sam37/metaxin N-terminal domain-containing protein n=1 Tax=Remersonia thermophila TaxID=72144 RepID=A0ABR4DLW6_9PEZI
MALRLYVWGPAFGLPSLDAECLAAIAYLSQTLSAAEYQLVRSSPSAVPTQHLPTLHDPSTDTWIADYTAITAYLHARRYPDSSPSHHHRHHHPHHNRHVSPPRKLTTAQADRTAYIAFLTAHAAPLLALYLYVSSANYGGATRPAFSSALPFPLPWTEPPAVRAAMARRAAHLRLSSLDTDSAAVGADAGGAKDAAGPVFPGAAVTRKSPGAGAGVTGAMAPEQRSRIRLEALAAEVFNVLSSAEWLEGRQPPEARCLAFAYLALMAVPVVPRPWLREILETRYRPLYRFVREFEQETFPRGVEGLPWSPGEAEGAGAVAARFARGVLVQVPGLGTLWRRWWTARKRRELGAETTTTMTTTTAAAAAAAAVAAVAGENWWVLLAAGFGLTAAGVGVWYYRALSPFGAAVQVWRRPATGSAFGAVGLLLSGALHGMG